MNAPKVSVIVTAHNYAEYLETCLDSALNQTYDNYEIIVVNDGSTDDTSKILREYTYEHPDILTAIQMSGEGLPSAANAGIEIAEGEYVIRLDADDYFDENILTVLATYLDSHPDVDLVYPDYYTFNDHEGILDHVRMPEVGEEIKLLNRSPLAAGAMYRRAVWEELGGYNEKLSYQEDYDFWIRFINAFDVQNINLPLMYYRQHEESMSTNLSERLQARRSVKREFVEQHLGEETTEQEVLAIIPARDEQRVSVPSEMSDLVADKPLALYELGGKPLINYTIDAAVNAERIDRVVVSTESEKIADIAQSGGAEIPFLRPERLSKSRVQLPEVVGEILDRLDSSDRYKPDLLAVLPYVSPLRTADHIDEAIDTFSIFSVDSVISVEKNQKFLWQPGKFGLEPLFEKRILREEKEGLYQENGAIYVVQPSIIRNTNQIIGDHVGHILMQHHNSVHIDSWYDLTVCEGVLSQVAETSVPQVDLEGEDA